MHEKCTLIRREKHVEYAARNIPRVLRVFFGFGFSARRLTSSVFRFEIGRAKDGVQRTAGEEAKQTYASPRGSQWYGNGYRERCRNC